jgi:hypothetical protein
MQMQRLFRFASPSSEAQSFLKNLRKPAETPLAAI